jgi:GTPase
MNKVAIIGRANVGKSTLYNKLSGVRSAMVSDTRGTTRDLKRSTIKWIGKEFELIDTGGFLASHKTPMKDLTKREQKKLNLEAKSDVDKQVEKKAREAFKESDIIILLTDGREGLNPQDREIGRYLIKQKDKHIFLVVNKCDNPKIREFAAEFHRLGLGEPILISAVNGSGTGDLLDIISKKVKKGKKKKVESDIDYIKVAILGKPNAGKSSLLNAISEKDLAIVSEVAHTTREPNATLIEYEDRIIQLADTAGIRRKARVENQTLEALGVSMSISALRKSHIALLVLDANEPISHQDLQLGKLIVESGVSVIIVVNKYDLVKQIEEDMTRELTDRVYKNFPHLSFAPVIFTSAKTGGNVKKILKLVVDVSDENKVKIPDGALSKFLKHIIAHQPPPRKRIGDGSRTKIKRSFITDFRQIGINPPLFECRIGSKEKLPEEYRKYILNQLRKKFGFTGVPIKLAVRYKLSK